MLMIFYSFPMLLGVFTVPGYSANLTVSLSLAAPFSKRHNH